MTKAFLLLSDVAAFEPKPVLAGLQTEVFTSFQAFRRSLAKEKAPAVVAIDLGVERRAVANWLQARRPPVRGSSLLLISDVESSCTLFPLVRDFGCDYLVKPIRGNELLLRLSLCAARDKTDRLRDLVANLGAGLTRTEERILERFLSDKDLAVSRQEIIRTVWPQTTIGQNTVDVHIFNLRRKMRSTGFRIVAAEPLGTWQLVNDNV